jgi:uncharacterized small protein (TIGR04563 family)
VKAVGNGFQQMVYFPEEIRLEIAREAKRTGRSINWIVRKAWELAREEMCAIPAPPTGKPYRRTP